MDWWPAIWMAGVYVAAWAAILAIAAKALHGRGGIHPTGTGPRDVPRRRRGTPH